MTGALSNKLLQGNGRMIDGYEYTILSSVLVENYYCNILILIPYTLFNLRVLASDIEHKFL